MVTMFTLVVMATITMATFKEVEGGKYFQALFLAPPPFNDKGKYFPIPFSPPPFYDKGKYFQALFLAPPFSDKGKYFQALFLAPFNDNGKYFPSLFSRKKNYASLSTEGDSS